MAESGTKAKNEEQGEGVCVRLEQLAQEELGETQEVDLLFTFYFLESLRKSLLFLR